MTNLLDIERALLTNEAVAQGLNLTELKKLLKAEQNAQKSKFAKSLALSKGIAQAHAWFKSPEAKALFNEAGVTWTMSDFALKVFGFDKSWMMKMVKAASLEDAKVERFIELCNEAESSNHATNRTIAGLLSWAKASEEQAAQADGDGDGEGDGDGAEASVAVSKTILTLSFKGREMGLEANVALRIDNEGKLTTTATKEQIELALALIQSSLAECL
jgi:hypothetical protein